LSRKVGTGIVTFQNSEPELYKIVTVPHHCFQDQDMLDDPESIDLRKITRKITWVIGEKGVNIQHWDRFAKVGDRVAVVRKETGVLNFFVNGEDQGPAATNVPERVYGVIDLYGQAAQALENVPFRRRQKSANRR
jgi:hypothetical protein